MDLRMVLVSGVACLGLSLPSAEQFKGWHEAARTWVNEQVATWNAGMPDDEGAFVAVAEPSSTTPVTDLAPARIAATAIEPANTTETEPVVVTTAPVDAPQTDFAGLDLPTAPMPMDDETDAEPADTPAPPVPTPFVALDAAFNDAQTDVLTMFAEVSPANDVAGSEPLEVADDELYTGLAFELNREAEGLYSTAHAERLAQAVRLTRDAVHAWANLLAGPAVVTLGR